MTTVAIFVAGYFLALLVLSVAVRPRRKRLAALAKEMLRDDISSSERHTINRILDSSYSMRAAPAHFLGVCMALLTPSERFNADAEEFRIRNRRMIEDPRWMELFDCHFASIAAVSPVFGALAGGARFLFKLKARRFVRRYHSDRRAVELFGEWKTI